MFLPPSSPPAPTPTQWTLHRPLPRPLPRRRSKKFERVWKIQTSRIQKIHFHFLTDSPESILGRFFGDSLGILWGFFSGLKIIIMIITSILQWHQIRSKRIGQIFSRSQRPGSQGSIPASSSFFSIHCPVPFVYGRILSDSLGFFSIAFLDIGTALQLFLPILGQLMKPIPLGIFPRFSELIPPPPHLPPSPPTPIDGPHHRRDKASWHESSKKLCSFQRIWRIRRIHGLVFNRWLESAF